MNVFQWKKDHEKSTLKFFWEAVVGTVSIMFKNQPKDQLATKIHITGSFDKTDVHVWPAVETLLRNAFIRALIPRLDQPMKIEGAEMQKSGTTRIGLSD